MIDTCYCLSIAGFDGSGGAGLQADLKTFAAFDCHGYSVLTAIPVQNTCGVKHTHALPAQLIIDQLECVFEDIYPQVIKIGMLFSIQIIEAIADFLTQKKIICPLVLDPVIVATNGGCLLQPEAIEVIKYRLFPLADLVTPNLHEANILAGSSTTIQESATRILQLGCKAVLVKGGHGDNCSANDLLLNAQGDCIWLKSNKINTQNTHGTGCTLAAAIAALLAKGYDMKDACHVAKKYVFKTIDAAKHRCFGNGSGPVDHFYFLKSIMSQYLD